MSTLTDEEVDILKRICAQSPLAAPQMAWLRRLGTGPNDAAAGIHGAPGTAWRDTYEDSNGILAEIALGASGTVKTSNGASAAPSYQAVSVLTPRPDITPFSEESMGVALAAVGGSAPASAVWPTANQAFFFPVTLGSAITVAKLFTVNGGAVSGNIDVGIYTSAYVKVITAGSTAQSGTTQVQSYDVADTPLAAGLYYIGVVLDNGVGTLLRTNSVGHGLVQETYGGFKMAAAFPLPDPIVPAAMANIGGAGYIPLFGFTTRTVV